MEFEKQIPEGMLIGFHYTINKMGAQFVSADFRAYMKDDLSFICIIHGETVQDEEQVINYIAKKCELYLDQTEDWDLGMMRLYCDTKGIHNERYNNPFDQLIVQKNGDFFDQMELSVPAQYLLMEKDEVEKVCQQKINKLTIEDVETERRFDIEE